eukprot:TRINITY_DN79390_c0_g1_i1.p1 TRINITY_DN79390_c0_g1~~TRINITY_DN79390_c0_g1_i1.p1  ORF type:complete len:234 (+),score=43.88 TRINITY_DN79390_c0_g1_i1:45-746(+)
MALQHHRSTRVLATAAAAVLFASVMIGGPSFVSLPERGSGARSQKISRHGAATLQPRTSECEAQFASLFEMEAWEAKKLGKELIDQEISRGEQIDKELRDLALSFERFSVHYVGLKHDHYIEGWSDSATVMDAVSQMRRCNDRAEARLSALSQELERLLASAGVHKPAHKTGEHQNPKYALWAMAAILCMFAFLANIGTPLGRLPEHSVSIVSQGSITDDEAAGIGAAWASTL